MDHSKILLCFAVLSTFYVLSFAQDSTGSVVLAGGRTDRKDPSDQFHIYQGGWDITNTHYWASVAYSGIPWFIVGCIWFLGFGIAMLFTLCCCCFCSSKDPTKHKRFSRGLCSFLLLFLTLGVIAGSIMLYVGEEKLHKKFEKTLGFVLSKADFTVENLRNVTEYIDQAKTVGIGQATLPVAEQQQMSNLMGKLTNAANELESQSIENYDRIKHVLEILRYALIIMAASMILLTLVGLLFTLVKVHGIVYLVIFVAWFLVAASFAFTGVSLVFYNVVTDTCVAMEEWTSQPAQVKTTLDDILPCVDPETARQSIDQGRMVTSDIVQIVNTFIDNVANTDPGPLIVGLLNFNQSGPLVSKLCDPYKSGPRCPSSQVNVTQAPKVWKKNVCNVMGSLPETCASIGRLSPTFYEQLSKAANVSYGIYRYTPFLVNLRDCTYVRETFSSITRNYCNALRDSLRWIYIGFALISVASLPSTIFWVMYDM